MNYKKFQKVNKLNFITMKTLPFKRHLGNKKGSHRLGKIHAKHVSQTGLVSRIYKELLRLTNIRRLPCALKGV